MNTKLILLSAFTLVYFMGAQWWYSNRLSGVCCGAEQASIAAPAAAAAASLPLAFEWEKSAPILAEDFAAFKGQKILAGMKEDNILQITGWYHSDEKAPEGFDNMGLARAAALRALIKADVPLERIDISSRPQDKTIKMEAGPFEGLSFNWMAAPEKGETTIVELENEVTIYFPFNSSVKDQNAKVDDYLKKLADRLKQTSEKVSITGHTDNVGEEESNQKLGLQRATSIRSILNNLGIDKERILIDSKGERQPATSNETEEGRHRNRRTVLNIIN
ncbi:MAG: OmpA family protein [Bacteroidota bacterium]